MPLALLSALLLQADAPAIAEWTAPNGCPTHAEAEAALRPRPPSLLRARVRIDEPKAEKVRWRAVIFTDGVGATRTRVIDGSSCEEVARAALLVIDLARVEALESAAAPTATEASPAPVPEVAPSALAEDAPAPAELEKSEPDGPASPPVRVSFRLGPTFASNVGVYATPTVGIGLGTSFGNEQWRLGVALFDWLRLADSTNRGEFWLISGSVQGCRQWAFTSWSLGPCMTVEGGSLSAQGLRLTENRAGSVPWLAVRGGAGVRYRAGAHVSPWASVDVGVNLIRPSFVFTGPEGEVVVHRVPLPTARLAIGVELSWE